MHQSHDVLLVVLSALVAFWGSYDAVRIAARVRAAEGRSRRLWLIAAGLSLGIGIWGMHFVAMLGLRLPVQIQYVPSLVLLSLFIAVAGTATAFSIHSRSTLPFRDLWLAFSTGAAISGMHYTAMAGMRLPAEMLYTPPLVVLSIGIAMVFPVLGIRPLGGPDATAHRPLWPGMLIATGIVGMHFTAMAAVRFVPQVSLAMPARSLLVASPQLAIIVFIGTAAMITMAELTVAISRQEELQRTGHSWAPIERFPSRSRPASSVPQ